MQYQGLTGFFLLFFPYIFPLQVQNVFHEVLHAGGAVLFHALGEMAVFIQGKGGGGVAHVGLHGFYIVPGPDRVHGISVPICYNKDKSGTPLKLKENRTCPYSFSNQIPGKIRPLRLRSKRRCYVRDKAKFSKPEARTYWHRKQNTAVQRSSHLLCTCAGEPTTYTMDSVHTAGPVYPFSGKYARKILRLDRSILCPP